MSLAHHPPTGFIRLLAKAPVWLYRLHLGWLLGNAAVQITHRGRKSRLIRRTILEVLRYDPRTREVVVVSGWQGKTDWYRNIRHNPALEIKISRTTYQPVQEFLPPQEMYEIIKAIVKRRTWEGRLLGAVLGVHFTGPEAEARAQIEDTFRGVRFRPADYNSQA